MYKNILETVLSLGISPEPAWKKLANDENGKSEEFLSKFLYPLLGLVALATFIGLLFKKGFEIEYALKTASVTFVSLFAGFFLASFLLNEISKKFFNREDNLPQIQRFVAYVSSFSYVISIIQAIFYDLFFLRFFLLYVIYIIWIGCEKFLKIEEKERYKFMITATGVLYFSPLVIEKLMRFMMPGLFKL